MAALMGPIDDGTRDHASAAWSGLDLLDPLGVVGMLLVLVVLLGAVVVAGLHGSRRHRF